MARAEPSVTVFAAASLKGALDEVAARFQDSSDITISLSYGGSSALTRQIQYGAPAQVFVSANSNWMDLLQDQAFLQPGTRVDLLSNRLVLIAGAGTGVALVIEPGMDLLGALNGGRLAMALVDAVPAGIYGREALQSLGVWDSVKDSVAQTDNVRAALRLVALKEAPLGIVYATDARAEERVRTVAEFTAGSHPPIRYPAAILAEGNSAASRAFFGFLTGPGASAIFRQYGFATLAGGGG